MALSRCFASDLLRLAALAAVAFLAASQKSPLAARQRPIHPIGTTTPLPDAVPQSTWTPCECVQGPCVCVMYYLCNVATNSVYIYGEDVLDERFGEDKVAKCPDLEFCCRIPSEGDGNAGNNESSVGGVEVRPPLPPPPPSNPVVGQPPPVPLLPPSSGEDPNANPPRGNELPPRWECGIRRTDFALLDTWARVDDRESDEVAFAEFPWTLVIIQNSDKQWLGGASLIRPRIALTAAHSVHGLSAAELRVRAGEWNAARADEPLPHQERQVVEVVAHPGFVRRALFHDAALLVLEAPFEAAPHVAPVCLPTPGASFDGRRCTATGWGADAPGKEGLRQLMRRVDLPVVPRAECEKRLRTTRLGIFFRLHESFMCAGAENGRDTCKGDGGGPLVCQSEDDPRRYEQAGIVSWGIGCADPEVPAVYTDVAKLRPWLDQQLESLDPQGL